MVPIEKKEIRGLTIGQFAALLAFLTTILVTGTLGYSRIMNKLENNEQSLIEYQSDKKTQDLQNKAFELSIRTLEIRIITLEAQKNTQFK